MCLWSQESHRAWLAAVATDILPPRVAACERKLLELGFTLRPPPSKPSPRPLGGSGGSGGSPAAESQGAIGATRGDGGAESDLGSEDEEERRKRDFELTGPLPPLPLGSHWSAVRLHTKPWCQVCYTQPLPSSPLFGACFRFHFRFRFALLCSQLNRFT